MGVPQVTCHEANTPIGRVIYMRRNIMIGGALVLALVGVIFLLQGINVLPGSFMTGQPFWAVVGLLCLLAGSGLYLLAVRRSPGQGR